MSGDRVETQPREVGNAQLARLADLIIDLMYDLNGNLSKERWISKSAALDGILITLARLEIPSRLIVYDGRYAGVVIDGCAYWVS